LVGQWQVIAFLGLAAAVSEVDGEEMRQLAEALRRNVEAWCAESSGDFLGTAVGCRTG
jgi:hypothetical protein